MPFATVVLEDLGCPGIEGAGGVFQAGGLLQVPGQGVQGVLVKGGSAFSFQAGQDGLLVFLERFAEPGAGDEAVGVIQVEPADLAVGAGAQLQDGNDAAEMIKVAVRRGWIECPYFHFDGGSSRLARGRCQ